MASDKSLDLDLTEAALVFSQTSRKHLEQMGIEPTNYEEDLCSLFKEDAILIDKLISHFSTLPIFETTTVAFNDFIVRSDSIAKPVLNDFAYDIFNYLRLFKEGGKFALFKGRQAEWDGPIVVLDEEDVPNSNKAANLSDNSKIYRGMSLKEFEGGKFGQSWTTDFEIAERFAFETYSDKPRGIVASASLEKANVIYYSPSDSEREMIVTLGSIQSATKMKT